MNLVQRADGLKTLAIPRGACQVGPTDRTDLHRLAEKGTQVQNVTIENRTWTTLQSYRPYVFVETVP